MRTSCEPSLAKDDGFLRVGGSDVDDAAITALDHMTSENLARSQCTGQVRIDELVPVSIGKVQCRRALVESGGINQDIHFPERLDRSLRTLDNESKESVIK